MKIEIIRKEQVEVKTMHVDAGVRYWEDAEIDGKVDVEGNLIPCREGDRWKPIIELETGKILNWNLGTTASIHYKVCDDGSYYLKNGSGETVASIEENYVPDILAITDRGYGDYIIMEVNADGMIEDWEPDLTEFTQEEG